MLLKRLREVMNERGAARRPWGRHYGSLYAINPKEVGSAAPPSDLTLEISDPVLTSNTA